MDKQIETKDAKQCYSNGVIQSGERRGFINIFLDSVKWMQSWKFNIKFLVLAFHGKTCHEEHLKTNLIFYIDYTKNIIQR